MALASLGMFVFQLHSAPFQQLQRQASQRWAENSRVGRRPALQNLGPGEDSVTLSGILLPELTGGPLNLTSLRTMMESGRAWTLIDGQGYLYGLYVIESVDETRTLFFRDGAPRRVEFSLKLKRVDEDRVDVLGILGSLAASVAALSR